jgi:hypothetical protein
MINDHKINLPKPGERVWGFRKKAAVVMAIRAGLLTRQEAFDRYSLSVEELAMWEAAFDEGGPQAITSKSIARLRLSRKAERSAQTDVPHLSNVPDLS